MQYTIFMKYSFTEKWFQMDRHTRAAYERDHVFPILEKYKDQVSVRMFDAEAFHTDFSDFALMQTADMSQYYFLMEALRNSPLFVEGFAKIQDIIMGIEDGFRAYAEQEGDTPQ